MWNFDTMLINYEGIEIYKFLFLFFISSLRIFQKTVLRQKEFDIFYIRFELRNLCFDILA